MTVWTERQWQSAMRAAGWRNAGQGLWVHNETGARFYAWTWSKWNEKKHGRGEAWYAFAVDRVTPTEAPF